MGRRLYVDGALVNELSVNTTTYTGDGYLAQVRATSLASVEALRGSCLHASRISQERSTNT